VDEELKREDKGVKSKARNERGEDSLSVEERRKSIIAKHSS